MPNRFFFFFVFFKKKPKKGCSARLLEGMWSPVKFTQSSEKKKSFIFIITLYKSLSCIYIQNNNI